MENPVVDFYWVLDGNYAHFLELGVASVVHFHPHATLYVYDISQEPSEKIAEVAARYKNVKVILWPEDKWTRLPLAESVDFDYYTPNWNAREEIKYWSRKIRYAITKQKKSDWIVDKAEWLKKQRRKILVWTQKASCAADCLRRTENNLVFLDADAIPLCPLNDVFSRHFDVALTLRKLEDVRVGLDSGVRVYLPLPYHAVNAGVLFFRRGVESRKFVDAWSNKMKIVPYHMAEQTALSMLCLDADADAFCSYEKDLVLNFPDGTNASVKLLPCEVFNNTSMGDCLKIREGVKVAHFKGYLHQDIYFSKISQLILSRLTS